jgi:hypothetical protein
MYTTSSALFFEKVEAQNFIAEQTSSREGKVRNIVNITFNISNS